MNILNPRHARHFCKFRSCVVSRLRYAGVAFGTMGRGEEEETHVVGRGETFL